MSIPAMATLAEMQAWARALMASRAPDFVIGDDYLRRWFVIPRNRWINVYLHDVRKSDDDRAFHDHPWANTSFIIDGSYVEHTPEGQFFRVRGDVVTREAGQMHRLEVAEGQNAISLFVTGPKIREWGFACDHGWVHWQDFCSEEDSSKAGRGCGEPGDPTLVTPIGQERALDAHIADVRALFDRAGASPAEHAELEVLHQQEREKVAHDQGGN